MHRGLPLLSAGCAPGHPHVAGSETLLLPGMPGRWMGPNDETVSLGSEFVRSH
jgi:hypothetical protein